MVNNTIDKYLNTPQYLFALTNPKEAALHWGRATGKTFPHAFRMANVAKKMKGSTNAIIVPSYAKFKKDFYGNLSHELAKLGFREHIDWIMGEKPSKHWDQPLRPPKDYDAILSFRSGTCYALFSQDGGTKNQGNNIASFVADECKLLKYDRIREDVLNAMRGGADLWGDIPEYRSKLYTCDGLRREGDTSWFYDLEKRADPNLMAHFIRLALSGRDDAQARKALDIARKNVFYYFKASAIENLHALGWDFFKDAYDNSSPMEFLVSILNYDMKRIEGSFYTYLSEDKQGYLASNVAYWERLGYDAQNIAKANCEGDNDVLSHVPLELSFDFGNTNFATVSHFDPTANTFYLLKDFIERTYEEIIYEFNNYYTPHKLKNRQIKLWYDVAGNKGMDQAKDNLTYVMDIKQKLEALGWAVILEQKKISYVPHNIKYNIWKKVLYEGADRDRAYPIFRYNRINAERTALSMGNAPLKEDRGVIKKDKSSEKSKKISQEKATHLSDAMDNAVCFPLYSLYMQQNGKKIAWVPLKP